MAANSAVSCIPNAECHSDTAYDAAVIVHEQAMATQAIRSPC